MTPILSAVIAAKWKVLVAFGGMTSTMGVLAQVDVVSPGSSYIESGLALTIAGSFFSLVGALVTDKIVSAKASERIAREAAVTAVHEYVRQAKESKQ